MRLANGPKLGAGQEWTLQCKDLDIKPTPGAGLAYSAAMIWKARHTGLPSAALEARMAKPQGLASGAGFASAGLAPGVGWGAGFLGWMVAVTRPPLLAVGALPLLTR